MGIGCEGKHQALILKNKEHSPNIKGKFCPSDIKHKEKDLAYLHCLFLITDKIKNSIFSSYLNDISKTSTSEKNQIAFKKFFLPCYPIMKFF